MTPGSHSSHGTYRGSHSSHGKHSGSHSSHGTFWDSCSSHGTWWAVVSTSVLRTSANINPAIMSVGGQTPVIPYSCCKILGLIFIPWVISAVTFLPWDISGVTFFP